MKYFLFLDQKSVYCKFESFDRVQLVMMVRQQLIRVKASSSWKQRPAHLINFHF